MPIPAFEELLLPILAYIADGKEHTKHDISEHLAFKFNLTHEERNDLLPSGKQTKFMNRVAWTRAYFTKALLIESPARGKFKITQRGLELLAQKPFITNGSTHFSKD